MLGALLFVSVLVLVVEVCEIVRLIFGEIIGAIAFASSLTYLAYLIEELQV